MSDHTNAPWWWGRYNERFTGPIKTRDEAIHAAQWDDPHTGFYIVRGELHGPLKLSDYFDAERFVETAEDDVYDMRDPESDDPIFDIGELAMDDLKSTVRAAIDAWQKKHGLIFEPYAFKWQGVWEWFAAEKQEADQ